jgi:hypothetical protein
VNTYERLARAMCLGIERKKVAEMTEWLADGAANLEIAADEARNAHHERTHRAAADVLGRLSRAIEAALEKTPEDLNKVVDEAEKTWRTP